MLCGKTGNERAGGSDRRSEYKSEKGARRKK
jgi:hypothetical protein